MFRSHVHKISKNNARLKKTKDFKSESALKEMKSEF